MLRNQTCPVLSLFVGAALFGAPIHHIHAALMFSGSYDEDFDGLGPSGTTLLPEWSAVRSAGSGTLGAPLSPRVTTGTATSGGIYNVGAAGDPDRALGSLASGSTVPAFGLQLINNTGSVIDALWLDATMEQWRSGSSASVVESVVFEYSLNALSLADSAALWTSFGALNLDEKLTTSTSAGALDGNLPDHQWLIGGELTGLNWSEDDTLTLRWSDADHPSSDGLYALDDFSIRSSVTSVPEPAGAGTLALGLGVLALVRRLSNRRPASGCRLPCSSRGS